MDPLQPRNKVTKFLQNQLSIKILTIGDESLAGEVIINQLNLKQLKICNDLSNPYVINIERGST